VYLIAHPAKGAASQIVTRLTSDVAEARFGEDGRVPAYVLNQTASGMRSS
jgi:hypothetical protein